MWKCRILNNDHTDYGAFSAVVDNLIGYIAGVDTGANTYHRLVEENRYYFQRCATASASREQEIAEPLEMMFLLNHLDTATRFYWVPRPYRRCGDWSKEFLVVDRDDTLACLFCGFKSRFDNDVGGGNNNTAYRQQHVRSPTEDIVSDSRLRNTVGQDTLMGIRDSVLRMAANARTRDGYVHRTVHDLPPDGPTPGGGGRDPPAPRYHFDRCPLPWLENSCQWRCKNSTTIHVEPSKFGRVLRALGGPPITSENEWVEFASMTSNIMATGACEETLMRCYYLLSHRKLKDTKSGNDAKAPPFSHLFYDGTTAGHETSGRLKTTRCLAYVLDNSSTCGTAETVVRLAPDDRDPCELHAIRGCHRASLLEEEEMVDKLRRARREEDKNEQNSSRQYLEHLLNTCGDGTGGRPPRPLTAVDGPVSFAIDAELVWRICVLHGFCLRHRDPSADHGLYNVSTEASFTGSPGRKTSVVRHTFKTPATGWACLYCGFFFRGHLCLPNLIEAVYTEHERIAVSVYAAACTPFPLPAVSSTPLGMAREDRTCGRTAVTPREVFSRESVERLNGVCPRKVLTNEDKLVCWLSASLNLAHGSNCIYRLKPRSWNPGDCPVCLVESASDESSFTCGHALCSNCIADLRITHCPICKNGNRKYRIRELPEVIFV